MYKERRTRSHLGPRVATVVVPERIWRRTRRTARRLSRPCAPTAGWCALDACWHAQRASGKNPKARGPESSSWLAARKPSHPATIALVLPLTHIGEQRSAIINDLQFSDIIKGDPR